MQLVAFREEAALASEFGKARHIEKKKEKTLCKKKKKENRFIVSKLVR
jgi:hypothetical protein